MNQHGYKSRRAYETISAVLGFLRYFLRIQNTKGYVYWKIHWLSFLSALFGVAVLVTENRSIAAIVLIWTSRIFMVAVTSIPRIGKNLPKQNVTFYEVFSSQVKMFFWQQKWPKPSWSFSWATQLKYLHLLLLSISFFLRANLLGEKWIKIWWRKCFNFDTFQWHRRWNA